MFELLSLDVKGRQVFVYSPIGYIDDSFRLLARVLRPFDLGLGLNQCASARKHCIYNSTHVSSIALVDVVVNTFV